MQENLTEVTMAQINTGTNIAVKQWHEYRKKTARLKAARIIALDYSKDNKL